MTTFNPFSGLIHQILSYQAPVSRRRHPTVTADEKRMAVSRMARGESPTQLAQELGVTKAALIKWQAKARRDAAVGSA